MIVPKPSAKREGIRNFRMQINDKQIEESVSHSKVFSTEESFVKSPAANTNHDIKK